MADFPPMDMLIPHHPPMRLIDRMVGETEDTVRAETVISRPNIFLVAGRGMPAYVGFEMMAQTVSAYDGLQRWRSGEKPAVGFLLGCRKYAVKKAWFVEHERLLISAKNVLGEGEMRSFQCRIESADGEELATGLLNVYRPTDADAFLNAQ